MSIDIKPNCKGSVEITDKAILERLSESYGEQILGIDIDFVAEVYTIPGRIFTSDPADAYPEEYNDERRATGIELCLTNRTFSFDNKRLDPAHDAKIWEIIELACDAYIYSAGVG